MSIWVLVKINAERLISCPPCEGRNMMLPSFGRYYRHIKRYRQITRVALRHGLGHLSTSLGLGGLFRIYRRNRQTIAESPATRLRSAFWELGPTFIKLGQLLSTRADLLPEGYIRELEKLQDTVPPASREEIVRTVEREFGCPLEQVFASFDSDPLGSASIAQVHAARLLSGEEVVVKVRRPGVTEGIAVDIDILKDIARFAEKHTAWGRFYPFTEMVTEFRRVLSEECDFTIEAQHAEIFRRNHSGNEAVIIPGVFWEYTRPGILVLERINGIKISDLASLDADGIDRPRLARRLAETLLQQMLGDGFFHADPHPGNLYVLPGNRIAFVDFGIVGRLSPSMKELIGWLVVGLTQKNAGIVTRVVLQMQVTSEMTNPAALKRDIEMLQQKYYEIPLSAISLPEAFGDMLQVAYRHRLRMPAELALLVKTLTTADGLLRRLYPEISIAEIASPIGRRFITSRLSIEGIKQFLLAELPTHLYFLTRLPGQITTLLEDVSRGNLRVKQENPDLKRLADRVDTNINRLILGLLTVTLLTGSFLLAGKGIRFFDFLPAAEVFFTGALFCLLLLLLKK
ncbi:MAG: AarF/ABC1/UbiB kinase family protein [Bacillota bacterium]